MDLFVACLPRPVGSRPIGQTTWLKESPIVTIVATASWFNASLIQRYAYMYAIQIWATPYLQQRLQLLQWGETFSQVVWLIGC
jgi:hypothetical protein